MLSTAINTCTRPSLWFQSLSNLCLSFSFQASTSVASCPYSKHWPHSETTPLEVAIGKSLPAFYICVTTEIGEIGEFEISFYLSVSLLFFSVSFSLPFCLFSLYSSFSSSRSRSLFLSFSFWLLLSLSLSLCLCLSFCSSFIFQTVFIASHTFSCLILSVVAQCARYTKWYYFVYIYIYTYIHTALYHMHIMLYTYTYTYLWAHINSRQREQPSVPGRFGAEGTVEYGCCVVSILV